MKCVNCDKEFENKRKSARFCSNKCRVYFNRGKDSVTDSVTDSLVSVTDIITTKEDVYTKVGKHKDFDICKVHKGFYKTCRNLHE